MTIGCLKPKLLIARGVREACTEPELGGIVAHELAHASRWDNLMRTLLRCLPDLLARSRTARDIERASEALAEEEADWEALRSGRASGIELAGALLKVARQKCEPTAFLPISPFHAGGPVERRVRRLINGASPAVRTAAGEWALFWVAILPPAVLCWLLPDLSGRLHESPRRSSDSVPILTRPAIYEAGSRTPGELNTPQWTAVRSWGRVRKMKLGSSADFPSSRRSLCP